MREPMFDDDTIQEGEKREYVELIVDLLVYTKKLEEMIVELREEVNHSVPKGQPSPYIELHSDIYENFYEYPAYEKYRKYIERYFSY